MSSISDEFVKKRFCTSRFLKFLSKSGGKNDYVVQRVKSSSENNTLPRKSNNGGPSMGPDFEQIKLFVQ
jgi:hypothetical protein